MKRDIALGLALGLLLTAPAWAAAPPAAPAPSQNVGASAQSEAAPSVPPPAPGVFTAQKREANRFHLVVTGHKFTSRQAIEFYLAYQASEVTQNQKGT